MTVILGEKSLLVYFETEAHCAALAGLALTGDQAGAYLTFSKAGISMHHCAQQFVL